MQTAQNFEAYKSKLDGKISEWNADIDKLAANAQQKGADAQMKLRQQVEEIRQKQSEATARLTEFGNATGVAAQEIKKGLDKALTEFTTAVDNARKQFH